MGILGLGDSFRIYCICINIQYFDRLTNAQECKKCQSSRLGLAAVCTRLRDFLPFV